MGDLARAGLSPKRRREAHGALRQVLKSAGIMVASEVKPDPVQRRRQAILSATEVERLAKTITPPFGTLVRFLASTGPRPSEATALRVRDLNLLHSTVEVHEAASLLEGRLVFGACKTHEARIVYLPKFLRDELEDYAADKAPGEPLCADTCARPCAEPA